LSDFDLLSFATSGPAKILGWSERVGTVEAGKKADLVVVAGRDGDAHSHLLTRSEHDIELVVINGFPRYGASEPMRRLLGDAAAEAESASIAGRSRLLDLRQATGDPVVGELTLREATDLLADALSRLPDLARDLAERPALDLADPRSSTEAPAFLVLDHDDLAGVDLRPHLPDEGGRPTAEPSPAEQADRGTPLDQLLEPLDLDALTAADDHRFRELLARERNLPKEIASRIPDLI
jgi:hypothetical protein